MHYTDAQTLDKLEALFDWENSDFIPTAQVNLVQEIIDEQVQ
jgi:hypothetical protein